MNPCTIFNDPCRPCLSYLQIYSYLHLSVYECICIKIYTKFAKLGHKNVICDRIRLRLYISLRWMELTAWHQPFFQNLMFVLARQATPRINFLPSLLNIPTLAYSKLQCSRRFETSAIFWYAQARKSAQTVLSLSFLCKTKSVLRSQSLP